MATVTEAPADAIEAEPMSPEAEISQKRKASSVLGDDEELSKRHKIDDDDHQDSRPRNVNHSPTEPRHRNVDADAGPARRNVVSKDEEKRRGKRLFGGLLSTLSQTSTSSQHKKRREIEIRQQERAQKQRAEDDKRRSEKLARITEARLQEQIKFDEKAMKIRHTNMLAMAHSLRTHAQPPIYFRPWKLSKEQEDTIGDQIQDAKAIIAREVEAFNDRREAHEQRYGRNRPSTGHDQSAPVIAESSADAPPAPEAAHVDAAAATGGTKTTSLQDSDRLDREPQDESGDVVEDAEEDMVIY